MRLPTVVLPVNDTALTAGCTTIASPTFGPSPCTMLSTPAGNPIFAASSPSIVAVIGVISDGFATTVLPAASAGAIFQVNRYSGRFNGETVVPMPRGWRSVQFSPAWQRCDSMVNCVVVWGGKEDRRVGEEVVR